MLEVPAVIYKAVLPKNSIPGLVGGLHTAERR